jgi:hypothetical protein
MFSSSAIAASKLGGAVVVSDVGLDIGWDASRDGRIAARLLKGVQEYLIWLVRETRGLGCGSGLPEPGNLAIIIRSFDDAALIRSFS